MPHGIKVLGVYQKALLKTKYPRRPCFRPKNNNGAIFQMNYKGKDRFENEESDVENMTGARYIVRSDISICFPSIYIHSIPRTFHGLHKAKKERSLTLAGNRLDKATQGMRDEQTNYFLIGPCVSNILSEIISISVDYEMVGKKYSSLSRHIDDYTFYAKIHKMAKGFLCNFQIQLRRYDLLLTPEKPRSSLSLVRARKTGLER